MSKYLFNIIAIALIVFLISTIFFQVGVINGESMLPTFKHKDFFLLKKFKLDIKDNDVVVIKTKENVIVKRVVGLPESSLIVKNNYLYVDGIKHDDIYISKPGILKDIIKLKDDEYFVLGDNRGKSLDSRFKKIGIIKKKNIIGKVVMFN